MIKLSISILMTRNFSYFTTPDGQQVKSQKSKVKSNLRAPENGMKPLPSGRIKNKKY